MKPMSSTDRICKLQTQIDAFYTFYREPNVETISDAGILAYTRLARPVVTELRKENFDLAHFITYGLPYDRDIFLNMYDFVIKAGAHALCGVCGGVKDREEAIYAIDNYIERMDDGGDGFPLSERWREIGINPDYRLSKKWFNMLNYTAYKRLGYFSV